MNAPILTSYEQRLVSAWEATHKQGQLTLWIFLALKDSPKTVPAIQQYLRRHTNDSLTADDQSLYRSLRRYRDTEMVDSSTLPSRKGGPPTKVYSLTPTGHRVLQHFIQRAISPLITNPQLKELL